MKIFPSKKSKELESACTLTTPTRKKERSLSSLVIRTNLAATKPSMRRAKALPQKPGMSREIIQKRHDDRDVIENNNHRGRGSSLEGSNKLSMVSKKQRMSCEVEPSQVVCTTSGPPVRLVASLKETSKGPNWELLTCLAEAADGTNDLNKPVLSIPASNMEDNDKVNMQNVRRLKRRARESISDQRNGSDKKIDNGNGLGKSPKLSSDGSEKFIISREQSNATSTTNGFPDRYLKRLYPVWLALLAYKDKNGDAYPQIPKFYIRVKDGNIPVSYINKYLVQKLNLKHESEVEVTCCGQKLVPSLTLNSLVDIWIRFMLLYSKEGERNSGGHNFVMVLMYGRK
ncbi:hypothetical protein HHK36_005923 [Tetracentron sinense]|uniref:Uncharacterized protein n=1 Tax=Tetracentron sinense TaxID=13715 RepID=A0A835DNM3_TETSI|nr:hypothetical protein HHK36_005923 [Tetracentron sinense]